MSEGHIGGSVYEDREMRQQINGLDVVSGKYYNMVDDRIIRSDLVSFTIPQQLISELKHTIKVSRARVS